MAYDPTPYDFSDLLVASRSDLRQELATTVADLCTAHVHTAYLRSTEGRGAEFFDSEGHLNALTEKKWLLLKLLDTLSDD